MLDTAKQQLRRILASLREKIRAGVPVVGLEPSCVAVFRDEMIDLMPHDEDAKRLQQQTFTFAEFLERHAPRYQPPRLERAAVVHGHCHQKAVLGMDAEHKLLEAMGVEAEFPDDGCCGMAGSFGFVPEKYEVSMKVGELGILPKVREAPKDTLIIADGFSCKTQIEHGTDRHALHVAQAIQMAMRDGSRGTPGDYPERPWLELERNDAYAREALLAGAALGAGAALLWRWRR
jgi:Fe-S oxidoreductase